MLKVRLKTSKTASFLLKYDSHLFMLLPMSELTYENLRMSQRGIYMNSTTC
jgi:hypothetical protein